MLCVDDVMICRPTTASCMAPKLTPAPCVPVAMVPAMVCPLLAPEAGSDRPFGFKNLLSSQIPLPHCASTSLFLSPVKEGCVLAAFMGNTVLSPLVFSNTPLVADIGENDQLPPSARSDVLFCTAPAISFCMPCVLS